jgi:hypothetical protein
VSERGLVVAKAVQTASSLEPVVGFAEGETWWLLATFVVVF